MAKVPTIAVITITEERLREIIREEVRRAVEPGAQRPPYLPPVSPYRQQDQWWQAPVITADQDRDYPNVTYGDDRGTEL